MATVNNIPSHLQRRLIASLLQLNRENDPKAISSLLSGIEECPANMIETFLEGILKMAEVPQQRL